MKKTIFTILLLSVFIVVNAQTYDLTTKFLVDDGAVDDKLGSSVSVNGSFAFVGAYEDDDDGIQSGSVYVWKYNGTDWGTSYFEKLTAGVSGAPYANFGNSVSVYENHAVIGANTDSEGGDLSGAIYIYNYNGTTWGTPTKIIGGAEYETYGASVCINGDNMIVGATYKNGTGAADIYHYNGTTWDFIECVVPSDGSSDNFGNSVSISGNYVIVGSPKHNSDAGAAYIYHFNGTNWQTEETEITGTGNKFGYSVSISGDKAIVGTQNYGKAYIFTNSGGWSQTQSFGSNDNSAFGESVSISGDKVIIGDWEENSNAGGAYIYTFNGSSWTSQTLTKSGITSQERFGNSVCISNNIAIVGTFWDDDIADQAGSATLYTAPPPPAPAITSQPQNVYVCQTETAIFNITATDAESYQWYNENGILSNVGDISGVTTNQLSIVNTEQADEADYYCIVSNSSGDTQSNNATLTVDLPVDAAAGTSQIICTDNTTLNANEPALGTGEWSIIYGGATFVDIYSFNTEVTALPMGDNILRWTITNGTCVSFDDVTITNDLIIANAGADIFLTDVTTTTLNANEPEPGTGLWSTSLNGIEFTDENLYNTLVSGLAEGNNLLTWTITNNSCVSSDDIIVNVYTSNSIGNKNNKEFNIFPNPTEGKFNLKNIRAENIEYIKILDISGKLILQINQNVRSSIEIDLSNQNAGLYVVSIKIGNEIYNKLVVKE